MKIINFYGKNSKRARIESDVCSENPVGGDHSAWNILIHKMDFLSLLKLSQQNHRLADIVEANAEYQLQKFKRHIRDSKYMYVTIFYVEISISIEFQIQMISALENVRIQISGHSTGL